MLHSYFVIWPLLTQETYQPKSPGRPLAMSEPARADPVASECWENLGLDPAAVSLFIHPSNNISTINKVDQGCKPGER